MSSQSYEIELVTSQPDEEGVTPAPEVDFLLALFATLTGLEKTEIYCKLPAKYAKLGSWGGQAFVEVAGLLGFNTNLKFGKFKSDTPWPCILRIKVPSCWGWNGKWWALAYNQGIVYNVAYPGWQCTLAEFEKEYRQCRITSMLQVWISDL